MSFKTHFANVLCIGDWLSGESLLMLFSSQKSISKRKEGQKRKEL